MDSLDAQCLLVQVLTAEMPAPQHWRHDRSGSLSCAYDGGENTFTWPPEHVADMARKWRESEESEAPVGMRPFVEAHAALEAMAAEGGLDAPDVVTHDLGRGEVRGVWEEQKVVLVVEEVGTGAATG